MHKKLLSLLLAAALLVTLAPAAFAQDLLQDSRFYFKQSRGGTCTLTSAAMMLRRRAYLDGRDDFLEITADSVARIAWADGLLHNFTYRGMKVGYATISGSADDRLETLAALLAEHPEGIVAYDRGSPHAILLTDYTDGAFYCSDPAGNIAGGRVPVQYASISLSNVSCYWYVAGDSNEQYGTEEVDELVFSGMFYPQNVREGNAFNLGGMLRCGAEDSLAQIEVQILGENDAILQYAAVLPVEDTQEWSFRELNRFVAFRQLERGAYTFYVTARTESGQVQTFTSPFTVSGESNQTLYYWSNKPADDDEAA